jgi:hypothetical protein
MRAMRWRSTLAAAAALGGDRAWPPLHRAGAIRGLFTTWSVGMHLDGEVFAMSLSLVQSRALVGLQAAAVTVEVHLANGLPSFTIVGR